MRRAGLAVWACLVSVGAMVLCASPALADSLELVGGETLSGKLQGERFSLETPQGRIEVGFDVLVSADFEESGNVRAELVDGTMVEGRPAQSELVLRQGLLDRTVPSSSVRRIVWSPPTVEVPAGTPIRLLLAGSVSSASTKAGAEVSLCTSAEVSIGGKAIIGRFAPAAGFVLGTGGGSNVSGGGAVVLRAGSVLARDGTAIALAGDLVARGGFEGSNWGLIGLLSEGSPAVAASGVVLEASTAERATVELRDAVLEGDQRAAREACVDFFRFSQRQEIPLEEVDPRRSYAPVVQPLRLSAPLADLVRKPEFSAKSAASTFPTRHLSIDGVSLASLSIAGSGKGKHGGYLEIDAVVAVRPSHDRWVSLTYELFVDDATRLRILRRQRIDAEERKLKIVKDRIELSREQTDALLRAVDPRLRITMTAIDN